MARPALVKLGGSLLTDKAAESSFKRAVARRLVSEIAKAEVPCVLLHGAGSFGHPQAKRHRIGQARPKPEGVADVLSAVAFLHAEVLALANDAGLRPLSVPLCGVRGDGDDLVDLPIADVSKAVEEGFTPVLHGTLVRDTVTGWRVLSADELIARLASETQPRLALFATDVDGVMDREPSDPAAKLMPRVTPAIAIAVPTGKGDDVTGRMHGKLQHALATAQHCPTLIVNGGVRNRVLDALRGKPVPCTRVEK
jgi:isopentenyl phosphate kinase